MCVLVGSQTQKKYRAIQREAARGLFVKPPLYYAPFIPEVRKKLLGGKKITGSRYGSISLERNLGFGPRGRVRVSCADLFSPTIRFRVAGKIRLARSSISVNGFVHDFMTHKVLEFFFIFFLLEILVEDPRVAWNQI